MCIGRLCALAQVHLPIPSCSASSPQAPKSPKGEDAATLEDNPTTTAAQKDSNLPDMNISCDERLLLNISQRRERLYMFRAYSTRQADKPP